LCTRCCVAVIAAASVDGVFLFTFEVDKAPLLNLKAKLAKKVWERRNPSR
jgi:hypothetical protein